MSIEKIPFFMLLLLVLASCNRAEKVPKAYQPTDAYDSYVFGLEQTNLLNTQLGKSWISASRGVLREPISVPLPYSEAFYLDPVEVKAMGLRFEAKRGQIIEVDIARNKGDSTFLFVDLFRIDNDSLNQFSHVASADSAQFILRFEPRRDSDYILRIIPELLAGGNYEVEIKNIPMLAFPVAGKNKWAIQSRFGADREGGRRKHHGVDIFAKRHTPILSPIRAKVREVGEQKLGGNVIWLRDEERRNNLYFAHLQTQLVKEGDWVELGDTIGTVGNSGNARTTPPHLHFGIYSRGPIDPYNYIVGDEKETEPIVGQQEFMGRWVRVREKVSLRSHFGDEFEVKEDFAPGNLLKVVAASGNYYRVEKADGTVGYVLAKTLEVADEPLETLTTPSPVPLVANPYQKPGIKRVIDEGVNLRVLGTDGQYLFVKNEEGETGWIRGL